MDNRRIGVAIPTYERLSVTVESFRDILFNPRVAEIVLSDDHSEENLYWHLKEHIKPYTKVNIFRNEANLDCFLNKKQAVILSSQQWNILLDSDNVLQPEYLDRLFEIKKWEPDTIYTPDFAMPNFDFRAYSGLTITKENVAQYIDLPIFETMLNAANYFVNREQYLSLDIWDKGFDPVTSDSIYVCLKWLEKGNKIKVVEGLQYFHRVHSGSHYQNNISRTPTGLHQNILNQLRQLK